jgi:hypothetical protein
MTATAQTPTNTLAGHPARDGRLQTALLTIAAVIVGSFVIAVVLVASLMLVGPLPTRDGAAPLPQLMPQPSAEGGLAG